MAKKTMITTADMRNTTLNVLGVKLSILSKNYGENSFGVTHQQGEAGMGPPPHSHDWDESFFILKGSVEFFCNGELKLLQTGTLIDVPAGTTHGFTFGPEGGEMLEITGANSQAAQLFTDIDREIPPGPPEFQKVTEVLQRNGVTLQIDN